MLKWLRDFIRWSHCRFNGHPAEPTGRSGFLLYEVCCDRCHRRFITGSPDHPGMLLPVDADFERIMADELDYIRRT